MLTKIVRVDASSVIVTLDEFCEHSRITDLFDEAQAQQCLDAATDVVERWLNRKLFPTEIIGQVDSVEDNEILLSYPPIISVSKVYRMCAGVPVELDKSMWAFDDISGSVIILDGVDARHRVAYTCGYDIQNPVPYAVKHAILMVAATLYENREDVIIGTQINQVPMDAKRVMAVHRNRVQIR